MNTPSSETCKKSMTEGTGEIMHKCNQCGYASLQKGHLKTHFMTHSGEKPYKCNQCDYASVKAGH